MQRSHVGGSLGAKLIFTNTVALTTLDNTVTISIIFDNGQWSSSLSLGKVESSDLVPDVGCRWLFHPQSTLTSL